MYEVGLAGSAQRVHAALLGEVIALAGIAGTASGNDVAPFVVPAARKRNQVIPRETLPVAEVGLAPVTVLAAVAIASEEECVGDLTAEAAGNVDELDQSYDRWFRKRQPFASDDVTPVRFDDLGFALDYQPEGTPDRDHGQRLKGGVQRQTPHWLSPDMRW
jgi:hypothetical protein